jgi:magnesium-transporting ATPase (P-type)
MFCHLSSQALKKYDPERATVLRDGKISEIDAAELVPGKHLFSQKYNSTF